MKIHTKIALLGATMLVLAGSVKATSSLEFTSGSSSSVSYSWYVSIPAGASAHSLVTATVGSVSNPAWYWGGTLLGFYWDTWVVSEGGGVLTSHFTKPKSHSGSSPSNPSPSYATAVAGIAGPPAGLLHEARITLCDLDAFGYDEKWTSNLVGGEYGIYHGGGVSGKGVITAVTEITW